MRKKLIVVDTEDSALARSALSRFNSEEYEIIRALEFKTLSHLLRHLTSLRPISIHFAWREVLYNLLVTQRKSNLNLLFSKSQIGFGVADYLGLSEDFRDVELYMIRCSDYVTVVNQDLAYRYFDAFNMSELPLVFHDSPDIIGLKKVQTQEENKALDFTWVGNSKWGTNYGINDYKGYEEYIRPIVVTAESEPNGFTFKIIDSAMNPLSNLEALRAIARSKMLILSSKQEGTGLPVLEALALGTLPISRRVGILPELLALEPNLPIFNSLDELQDTLKENLYAPVLSPDENRLLFNRYMATILQEKLPEPCIKETVRVLQKFGVYSKFRANLLWQLRRAKRRGWIFK